MHVPFASQFSKLIRMSYSFSKWRFTCSLSGQIVSLSPKSCWLLSLEQLANLSTQFNIFYTHVFGCQFIDPHLTIQHWNIGVRIVVMFEIREVYLNLGHQSLVIKYLFFSLHFTKRLNKKAEPVQVHFTLRLRDQRSRWMQGGCKVYMDSYMATNGSCFMVTWILLKNHLLEVSLTQNVETMALRMLTTVGLFYFIMCEDPHV